MEEKETVVGTQGIQGIQGVQGIQGLQGVQGIQGIRGEKGDSGGGESAYIWVKYATSDLGEGMSDSSKGMTHIGVAFNKSTPVKSDKPSDYEWINFKGATGERGLQGLQGIQGVAGVAGATGATGATGLQGVAGLRGERGERGEQGLRGEKGESGTGTGTSSQGSDYLIELDKWGIKQGAMGKPPYTTEKWAVAYNNLLGFNNALKYAKENGKGKVVVPYGIYSFCYTNLNGGAEIYAMQNTSIKILDHQTLDLNGSQFEMMYDSLNKNPYDKSPATTPAWKLAGTLIELTNVNHSHVINGTIIGDIPNRSFSDGGRGFNAEYGMEQTYGIKLDRGCKFCSFENLDVSMFMGDGITMGCYPTNTLTWNILSSPKMVAGYVDDTGATIAKEGAYVSPKAKLIRGVHKEIQMRTGGGYTRIPNVKNHYFEYLFFDDKDKLVSRKKSVYLQNTTVPHNAYTVAVQLINEDVGLTELVINFAITMPQTSFLTIKNCELHDNHRGGTSGGADFTTIEKCKIYNNGMDSGIGVPVFPDTTRYQINFEDSYCNFLKVKDCHFFSGFHSILAGAYHVEVSDCLFQGVNGVIVYNNATTVIKGNTFDDCGGFGLMPSMNYQRRTILFTDNIVNAKVSGFNVEGQANTFMKITDNVFNVDSLTVVGNIEFKGNSVKALTGAKWNEYIQSSINCTVCEDNTFENFGGNNYYRFYASKRKGSDSTMKNNTFKNMAFNSVNIYNDTEFENCKFYNCSVRLPIGDRLLNSSLNFVDCLLQDTQIDVGGMYVNVTDVQFEGKVQKVSFEDCKVIFTPDYKKGVLVTIGDNVTSSKMVNPRVYEIEFIGGTFDNQVTATRTRFMAYAGATTGDYAQLKKVTVEDTKLKIADITKFGFIADESGSNPNSTIVVKNAKLKGFDAIPATKNIKTEVYVQPLTKL